MVARTSAWRRGRDGDQHRGHRRRRQGRRAPARVGGDRLERRLAAAEVGLAQALDHALALEHRGLGWLIERDQRGVGDRHERHRLAARGQRVPGQPDHAVRLIGEHQRLADGQPERGVGDQLAVRLLQVAAAHQGQRLAGVVGPAQADHGDAHDRAAVEPLDELVGVGPGRADAGHGRGPIDDARVEPRRLGERPAGVALHHPQLGAHRPGQDGGVVDHAGVDALHRDHHAHQEPDAGGGADEAGQVPADVADREVHGRRQRRPSGSVVPVPGAASTWSPARSPSSTST
jgi:hypothetical protein